MRSIDVIQGQMMPLPRANVDTDQIIPKQFLKRVERSGFGPYLFYDWVYDHEGEIIDDFILNDPDYRNASVLVSGPNFGSGSSREHAPWALEDWGFEAVIAPSFADIFHSNCHKIGLLPVVLAEPEVEELTTLAANPSNEVVIDLERQIVSSADFSASFHIDPFAKRSLMNGLDHIALTLEHDHAIDRFESSRPSFKPSLR